MLDTGHETSPARTRGLDAREKFTTTARILAIANPRQLAGRQAILPADIAALLAWVQQGGSLLLSIDHSPFDLVDDLLSALGLVHLSRDTPTWTFTRAAGSLNALSAIANGSGPAETVDEVTTFTGTVRRTSSSCATSSTGWTTERSLRERSAGRGESGRGWNTPLP